MGTRPIPVLIDGGLSPEIFRKRLLPLIDNTAIVQTIEEDFDFNGESDLDLEVRPDQRLHVVINANFNHSMACHSPIRNPYNFSRPGILLRVSQLPEAVSRSLIQFHPGAGFDNWLDAVDGSFCTFEGGDDPEQVSEDLLLYSRLIMEQDGIYPDPLPGGFKGEFRVDSEVNQTRAE